MHSVPICSAAGAVLHVPDIVREADITIGLPDRREARIADALLGSRCQSRIVHAGGVEFASRGDAGTQAWAKRCAAGQERAATAVPGRATTAIGISANNVCQCCQRGSWIRLSLPISQTKCSCGKRRFSARSVSTVNRVCKCDSRPVTTIRGLRTNDFAAPIRASNRAMPRAGLSGFCGLTSHQTKSSFSRRSASSLA